MRVNYDLVRFKLESSGTALIIFIRITIIISSVLYFRSVWLLLTIVRTIYVAGLYLNE